MKKRWVEIPLTLKEALAYVQAWDCWEIVNAFAKEAAEERDEELAAYLAQAAKEIRKLEKAAAAREIEILLP